MLRRTTRTAFWSPWIFAVAALLGLVARLGDVAERETNPLRDEARALLADAPGSRSEDVEARGLE